VAGDSTPDEGFAPLRARRRFDSIVVVMPMVMPPVVMVVVMMVVVVVMMVMVVILGHDHGLFVGGSLSSRPLVLRL
jgi:hypothetical protein